MFDNPTVFFLLAMLLSTWLGRRTTILVALFWVCLQAGIGWYGVERVNARLGWDIRYFLVLGSVVVLIQCYRHLLRYLRAGAGNRVAEAGMPLPEGPFSQAEVSRYARHLFLREIGGPGQQKLKAAKVLVVGAGGLGSPVLLYLAGAGLGEIGVIDDDLVELPNLQRQIIHTDAGIGTPKVFSAEAAMKALNPFVEIRPYQRRLDENVAEALIADYDLVLDGTDNFDTRYLVNRVCARLGKPLISGAMTQWEGQLSLWDPAQGGPCYECVFPERPAPGMVPSCAGAGVVAPLPGVIGAMMALEAVKHITGAGEGLMGRLMIHDALYAETRMIRVKKRKGCPACGG
ncbi:HesA/MoeB/ThiF family protein [Pseudogemmobacter bohemicus]|uniref:HesA/MoeB/ThiF family protein n=1 Tax=Pseudogemmobacter bohemicus TaxID=2250708 RepID=UPI001E3481A6|nr:HesA/MoeB/ThiF family protein [Pseudogemmobacter bohemicus]